MFIIELLPGVMVLGNSVGILVRGLDMHSVEKHLSNDKGGGACRLTAAICESHKIHVNKVKCRDEHLHRVGLQQN